MIKITYPYFSHSATARDLPLENLERELILVAGACASYLIEASFDKAEGDDVVTTSAKDFDMDNPFLKLTIERSLPSIVPTSPPSLSLSQNISTPINGSSSSISSTPSSTPAPILPLAPRGNDWVKSIVAPAEQTQFLLDFVGSITKEEQERITKDAEKAEEEAVEKELEDEKESKSKKKKDAKEKKTKKGKGKKDEKKERSPKSRRESANESSSSGSKKEQVQETVESEKKPEEPQIEPGNGLGKVLAAYLEKFHTEEKAKEATVTVAKEAKSQEEIKKDGEEAKEVVEVKESPKKNRKAKKGKKGKKAAKKRASKKKQETSDESGSETEGESKDEQSSSESEEEEDVEKVDKEKTEELSIWGEEEGGDFGLFDMFDDNEEKLAKSKLSRLTGENEGLQAMRTTFAAVLYLLLIFYLL